MTAFVLTVPSAKAERVITALVGMAGLTPGPNEPPLTEVQKRVIAKRFLAEELRRKIQEWERLQAQNAIAIEPLEGIE